MQPKGESVEADINQIRHSLEDIVACLERLGGHQAICFWNNVGNLRWKDTESIESVIEKLRTEVKRSQLITAAESKLSPEELAAIRGK